MSAITSAIGVKDLVTMMIIERFGSKENFGSKIICLWNKYETVWQLCINYKGVLIPLMPEMPSYPNRASEICMMAGKSLMRCASPCVAEFQSSFVKGYNSNGFTISNPQGLDIAVTTQLGLILANMRYIQFPIMPETERYGYEEEAVPESDFL